MREEKHTSAKCQRLDKINFERVKYKEFLAIGTKLYENYLNFAHLNYNKCIISNYIKSQNYPQSWETIIMHERCSLNIRIFS